MSKKESDRVVDFLKYTNHYVLIKKSNILIGKLNKSFTCRRCLKPYTNENFLLNHKEKCGEDNKCTIRTSSDSHLHWKNRFHKNTLYFRTYADFEADNEIDNSSVGFKTSMI